MGYMYLIHTATQYILNRVFLLLYHYFLLESGRNRPIANMATISPKRGFSVATVAKGCSLVYMLMQVRYLVVFFTLETIKNFQEEVIVGSLC